ncbi:MAG: DUF58 domain-containing protein [Proteobacteria bacterium]|nr:DUF58 domain-containing protein [Pseudomonadota bacterium]
MGEAGGAVDLDSRWSLDSDGLLPDAFPALSVAAASPPQGETCRLQPTPRLAAWFSLTSLGLLLDPLLPGVWVFTVLGLGALVAAALHDARRVRWARALEASRHHDPVFSNGVDNVVTLALHNPTDERFQVEVLDEAPPPFQVDCDMFTAALGPREVWEVAYRLRPAKRGDYCFGGFNLRARSALGLLALNRRLVLEGAQVRVYPNLRDLKSLRLLGLRDHELQAGLRVLRVPHAGREFEALRDYQRGDEWRTVDWKATARRQRHTVRTYDVERSQKILIALDLGRTMSTRMGSLSKADVAVNSCVLLTAVAARLDDRVGMLAFADAIKGWLPPVRGPHQATRLLDFLYPLEAVTRESDYQGAFSAIATRLRSRTLVVLFTDLVDVESSSHLIRHLSVLAARHSVLCISMSDHELEDLQDAAPADVRALYRQTVASAMLEDRELAIARLQERGVRVMKARPKTLALDLVNRYCAWKAAGRL